MVGASGQGRGHSSRPEAAQIAGRINKYLFSGLLHEAKSYAKDTRDMKQPNFFFIQIHILYKYTVL